MKTTKEVTGTKKVTTWSCDADGCDVTTDRNTGCCGISTIMICDICNKHVCHKHRELHWDERKQDGGPDVTICKDCEPHATEVREVVDHIIGRYDNLLDVFTEVHEHWDKHYKVMFELENYPDTEFLWHSGYYDKPLSGLAVYKGTDVWFQIADEDDEYVWYSLYRLSPSELGVINKRHKMFQKMVGYNCDHHPNVFKPYCKNNTTEQFYDAQKSWETVDYTENEIIATIPHTQVRHLFPPR